MQKNKPQLIGDIGEYIAHSHLLSIGYQIAQYGKATSNNGFLKLPIVPDTGLGYSRGVFGMHTYLSNYGEWEDSDIPDWCDVSYQHIVNCAQFCHDNSECSIRDSNINSAPCSDVNRILDKEWLCSISPKCEGPSISRDGQTVIPRGNVIVGECIRRFRVKTSQDYRKNIRTESNFILSNQLVGEYIAKVYNQWCNAIKPLLHKMSLIKEFQNNGNPQEAEKLISENNAILSQFPNGHPGRYDWIGYKDGELVAIEVKANSSRLQHWQVIRMGLLKSLGYRTLIVRVSFGTKDILKIQKVSDIAAIKEVEISLNHNFDFTSLGIAVPTFEEFIEVINWTPSHVDGDTYPIFY